MVVYGCFSVCAEESDESEHIHDLFFLQNLSQVLLHLWQNFKLSPIVVDVVVALQLWELG